MEDSTLWGYCLVGALISPQTAFKVENNFSLKIKDNSIPGQEEMHDCGHSGHCACEELLGEVVYPTRRPSFLLLVFSALLPTCVPELPAVLESRALEVLRVPSFIPQAITSLGSSP